MKWPYILNKDVRQGILPIAGITVMYGLLNAALYQRAQCITDPLSLHFPPHAFQPLSDPPLWTSGPAFRFLNDSQIGYMWGWFIFYLFNSG